MIRRLQIEGMAIIDSLAIEFSPGFNVITGETGAGKSILIKALNFLTGAKAGADVVRQGRSAATVTGSFSVPVRHPALRTLEGLGIAPEAAEDGRVQILLRRQLTDKGRTQGWVNDVPVTGPTLRLLGTQLLDIFAQHENQRLLEESEHLRYLDNFLGDCPPLKEVERLNRECLERVREVGRLVGEFVQRQRDRDYVEFRLKALREFEPTAEDYQRVSTLVGGGERLRRVHETLATALATLEGEEFSASRAAREVAKSLTALALQTGQGGPDAAFAGLAELGARLETAATELEDVGFELGRLAATVDVDEGELEAAQSRLFGYQNLLRKYGVADIDGLVEEAARLEGELGFLQTAETRLRETLEGLAGAARELETAARDLGEARRKAAKRVRTAVEAELDELAMKGARFEVELEPVTRALPAVDLSAFDSALRESWNGSLEILGSLGDRGAERGRFLLSSNPGEPLLPLARIASGGEMSRILLALKKALVADADTCVLVFDEIDTGISGRVADVVGRKLRELADDFQVICISHLPQVAVYADSHLLVKKTKRGDRTESQIVALTSHESAGEIARLLSGAKVDDTSLAHARNLIEKARKPTRRRREARP